MDLRLWLSQQGLTVRQLARELDLPLKTVQDWVYRGKSPSPANQELLDRHVKCAHYWVIDVPDGPVSQGTCKICGEVREFSNSIDSAQKIWVRATTTEPVHGREG